MSQTDLNVANASGAVVRADLNDHLQALATNNSGATAPTTTFPHQWWFDESNNDLNQRNAGNTAWILVARKDGSGWTPYRQGTLLGILATKNSNVLAKTAAYTVVVADDGKLVDADATTAAFTVTLPTAASAGDGFIISVKKTDSSANAITVDAAGAELIDGATTQVLSTQFDVIVLYCDGTEWHIVAAANDGALQSVQVFTGDGTYTKAVGLKRAVVEVQAGGGGSGGCNATGGGNGAGASGGGGGGYSRELLEASAIGVTETVTVGAGGTAATAGNNVGGAGGTSSFGSLLSATGGGGGAGSGNVSIDRPGSTGAAGGVGSGGSFDVNGQGSSWGFLGATGGVSAGGAGGSGHLGGGALGETTGTTTNGTTGPVFGGGASGSALGPSQSSVGGSVGGAGIVIVWEYF